MNLFIVICICHQQTYSIIHAVNSPFNQYKSFACFHYHSNVWEINRISVAAVIFLAKYNISGHRESSPWCCNSIIREYIWQTSFGWGSYKKLLTHLHKLTNGLVREYLLICVGSLSHFFFLPDFKRIVCDNSRLRVISWTETEFGVVAQRMLI